MSLEWDWTLTLGEEIYFPVGASKGLLGTIMLKCNYSCDKMLRKCEDDFKVSVDVQCSEGDVELGLRNSSSDGKLNISARENEIDVKVGRGRGYGSFNVEYEILYQPPGDECKDTVKIFVYKIDKSGKIKIFEQQVCVNVINPFELEYRIYPESDIYFVGDKVKLELTLTPKYRGEFRITASTTKVLDVEDLKPQVVDFDIPLKDDRVKVTVYVPELNYHKDLTISLPVKKPPRLKVKSIEVDGDVTPGSSPVVRVELVNLSPSTTVEASVSIEAYGVKGGRDVKLKPNETSTVQIRLPPVSFRDTFESTGLLRIVEFGEFVFEKTFALKEVKPFPFDVDVEEKITVYSSKPRTVNLKVKNDSTSDLNVEISCSKSEVCEVNFCREVNVSPTSMQNVELTFNPSKVGKDKITLQIYAKLNGILVKRVERVLDVNVLPSFSVEGVEIVKQSTKNKLLLGQEVMLQLDLVSNVNEEFEAEVRGVTIDVNQLIKVHPGRMTFTISGIAKELGKVSFIIDDGVYSTQIDAPAEIVKPYIVLSTKSFEIYGGVESYLRVELENPFDETLLVSYIAKGDENVTLLSEELRTTETIEGEMKIPPLSRVDLPLSVLAKKVSEGSVSIELNAKYGSITGDRILDQIKVIVKSPIEVISKPNELKIVLPYPPSETVFGKNATQRKVSLVVVNKTDVPLENVRISLSLDTINLDPSAVVIPVLSPRQQDVRDVVMSIPYSTIIKEGEMVVDLKVRDIYEESLNVLKLSVNRVNMFSALYSVESFSRDCEYPFVEAGDYVEVLVPVGFNLKSLGKPVELSELIGLILMRLRLLGDVEPDDIWSATARYIYERVNPNGKPEKVWRDLKSLLEESPHRVKDIVIVPKLLWKFAICKFTSYQSLLKELIDELNQIRPGIISMPMGYQVYSLRDPFYEKVVKVFKRDEPAEILRSLSNKKVWEVGDIAAFYTLITGNGIEYDKEVANYLKEVNKTGYLLYVCSSGWEGILNKDNLNTIAELIENVQDSKGYLALSLLYMFLINRRYRFEPRYEPIIEMGEHV